MLIISEGAIRCAFSIFFLSVSRIAIIFMDMTCSGLKCKTFIFRFFKSYNIAQYDVKSSFCWCFGLVS